MIEVRFLVGAQTEEWCIIVGMSESNEFHKQRESIVREEVPGEAEVSAELTGDSILDSVLHEIDEAAKQEEGAVVVIGAATGEWEHPAVASEAREGYEQIIKHRRANAVYLPRKQEGYSVEALQDVRRENPGKVIVVDAPMMYDKIMELSPSLEAKLHGSNGQAAVRELLEKVAAKKEGSDDTEISELKERAGATLDALVSAKASLGNLRMALPNNAPTLAFIAYLYALKNPGIEWNDATTQSLFDKLNPLDDATFYLRLDESGSGIWYGDDVILPL